MRITIFIALLLAVILTPLYGQTTGEVLDQKIESMGRSAGASADEISSAQQLLRNSVPQGALDGGWTVVSPFDSVHVASMGIAPPGQEVTLIISPQLAEYVDNSGPRGLGASIRSYAFFLGRGLTGTMAAYLERYVGPVTVIHANDIPGKGLVVVPALSNFSYKFVPADLVKQTIRLDLNLDVRVYWNGRQIHSMVYKLEKFKGPESFILVNSGPVAQNMVLVMSELVSRAMQDINTAVIAHVQSEQIMLDMDKVMLASLSWEDYRRLEDRLTKEERGLAHYFMAIDRAYRDRDPDRQAELLARLRAYVRNNSIEPTSRRQLIEEIRMRHAMRDVQQGVINDVDDSFYNFAGENTEAWLNAAEIAPDVAKVGILVAGCTNPFTCAALAATMQSFDTAELTAKVVGASSAEFFFGSGKVTDTLLAGTESLVVNYTGSKLGDKLGSAVLGKMATRKATGAGGKMAAYMAYEGYSDDFTRYAADCVYHKYSEGLLKTGQKAAQVLTGPGTAYSWDAIKKAGEDFNTVRHKSVTAQANPPMPLPEDSMVLAGGQQ